MTLCLLVRHAAHDLAERVLVGRMCGVTLGQAGRRQAGELAASLARLDITAVQSSPRSRAFETAAIIAERARLPVEICPALDELDFGAWTGGAFTDLAADFAWRQWNERRAESRPPGGESMAEAQARILAHLRKVSAARPNGRIVMVTHAEIIRAAALHARSMPLDAWSHVDVAPASVAVVRMGSDGQRPLVRFSARAAA